MVHFGKRDDGEKTEEPGATKDLPEKNLSASPHKPNQSSQQNKDESDLSPALQEYRDKIFDRLVIDIDLRRAAQMSREELRVEVENFIAKYAEENMMQVTYSEQHKIAVQIVSDMVGLGPLDSLFQDPSITDIMVNGPASVYVERYGKLEKTNVKFRNNRHVFQIAQRISSQAGRRIDESSPIVDTRLKDGSRVNIAVPPVALDGVSISIRRFSEKGISLSVMAEKGNISPNMMEFFKIIAHCRMNIIVSGGTGAGKTTLLNALSQLIDPQERIVTIEDSAELRLHQPHVVRLESRPQNIEGQGEITIRDLVKNALRMRPDRIIVGECRGSEAFDMLQAMNTGHDGSMSTLHANNAAEALNRLENMVLMAGFELPIQVIEQYIAGAINIIVQIARMRDGIRRVIEVIEIIGYDGKNIITRPLFRFKPTGEDEHGKVVGMFEFSGQMPEFMPKIEYYGLKEKMMQCLK